MWMKEENVLVASRFWKLPSDAASVSWLCIALRWEKKADVVVGF
jgi:hypothetical protein